MSGEEKPRTFMATSTGYCYSDPHVSSSGNQNNMQNHMVNQLQSFEPAPEIYNMEILGFPSKNLQDNFFTRPGIMNHPSSSKEPTSNEFYHQHDLTAISDTISSPWNLHDDDINPSNLRSCVFPCEGNERPSQGLSLSLSSSNPSSIGLQSFELRQNIQHEQLQIRHSKYLGLAQELLNEFCNLGTKENDRNFNSKMKVQKINEWDDEHSAIRKQSLYSLDFLELQKRKTRLIQMLEEVDRRYKHYCNQMKSVVQSFEAVAGNGAATVYSSMASRAMSRHFRCLRDGIVNQIKATKKAIGDKDSAAAPGTIKGETPRLRLLDQTLRQQRALQQMSLMESHPWRPQRGLPERSVSVLRAWLFEHFLHPYPSDVDKHILARQTGLSRSQVSNWFINARVRLWKPMVEEMYIEELKDQEDNINHDENQQNNSRNEDQKPTHDQLVIDSESLSSIINNPEKNEGKKTKALQNLPENSYNTMELDFSSYNHHHSSGGGATAVYGGGGVSLTLGLHQNSGSGGVSLAFPAASQGSLFYSRDQMEDCQTVQYSLLESENQTNLPYRNLMGAQLLHDLAG